MLEILVVWSEATPSVPETGISDSAGWEDPVSGLPGPDFWQRLLTSEVARSARYRRPLTVVLLDVVGVEDFQLAWGEDVGPQALREIALCLRRMARSSDHCARIGTFRFGILLTETDEIAAINFVERLREAGPRSLSRADGQLRFTFGWASPNQGEGADDVVRHAASRIALDRAD